VNILLVDDLPANLLALRATLDGMGYNFVEAHSVEEALRRLQDQDFAVVVLDAQPDGFEKARRIRSQERSRHTPIIFVSAPESAASTLAKTHTLAAVEYLVKPLVADIVRAKVAGLVELFEHVRQAKRQAEQFRLLVEGTKEYAIFMLDPEGRIVTWNPGVERIKGYQSEEIIGQHFSRFYSAEDVQAGKPEQELKQAIATGKYEEEGWRVRKDGSRFWASVVITALRDETRNLQGFSKVTRDMTAHKDAEENARRLIREEAGRQAAEASLPCRFKMRKSSTNSLTAWMEPPRHWLAIKRAVSFLLVTISISLIRNRTRPRSFEASAFASGRSNCGSSGRGSAGASMSRAKRSFWKTS
jgi:PAS domain S-box-containing protein